MGSSSSVHYDPFSLQFSDHYVLCDHILGRGCYGEVKAGRLRPSSYASNYNLEALPSLDDGGIDQTEILTRVETRLRLGRTDRRARSCIGGAPAPFAVKLLRRRLRHTEVTELDRLNTKIAKIESSLKRNTDDFVLRPKQMTEKLLHKECMALKRRRLRLQRASRKIVSSERVRAELLILSQCRPHAHIVDFVEAFESDDLVHIVFERAYGDAFSRGARKAPEKVCKKWARQMLDVLQFLNHMSIVHRDIKPENVFLKTKRLDGDILLGDFGMAMQLKSPHDLIRSIAGSAAFLAPETWRGHYQSIKGDVWAAGVTIYNWLEGELPFHQTSHVSLLPLHLQLRTNNSEAIMKATRRTMHDFCELAYKLGSDGIILATVVSDVNASPAYARMSRKAQAFVELLLDKDITSRVNPTDALQHMWLS